MPLPDDDRRAVAARLATTAAGALDAIDAALDDTETVRDVLIDVDRQVVALTDRRVLFVDGDDVREFGYGSVDVRRRDDGLGIDARVEGERLVLDVARSTFVRLGVVGEGGPPSRATWLPVRAPAPAPAPAGPEPGGHPEAAGHPQAAATGAGATAGPAPTPSEDVPPPPPPGWHPDPSGRHWWRWWDGRSWTEHVADGGAPYVDPLPPR